MNEPMQVRLECLSHSPVMNRVAPRPQVEAELRQALADARARHAAYAPDLIVLFAPDHFNGMFYDLMPPFCIAAGAEGLGDYGTHRGPLPVPRELAERCAESVQGDGIDVSLSHRLRVDHGFTQSLELLSSGLGGLADVPVLPVFVNCIAWPRPPTRRVRLLGAAIGRYLRKAHAAERLLIVGSGGLSHDPPIPNLQTAPPAVRARLVGGEPRTAEEQQAHESRVIAAAHAFSAVDPDLGGGAILPLTPEWDRQQLAWLCAGDFAALDALSDAEIGAQGGGGGHELRTWIAAFSCLSAWGEFRAETAYYRALPEWIVGFGVAHGRAMNRAATLETAAADAD